MSERYKQGSIIEIMNEMLSKVRDFYDSEYAYYVEKEDDEIITIYEWCAEGVAWQRDRMKMLEVEQWPKWMQQDIIDTREADYSVSRQLGGDITGVLAVVGVHKGGCDTAFLAALLPYVAQAIVMNKEQKQHEYLSYHDDLTGLLNRNSFVGYMGEEKKDKLTSIGALSVDINGLKNFNKEFGREYGDEVVIRVGEILEECFRGAMVFRLTGDEFLVLVENTSYSKFTKQIDGACAKFDNISLSLVTMGCAWEKTDIDITHVVSRAEEMMREEKQKYYAVMKNPNHEPIIKKDLLEDIELGRFIVCLQPKIDVQSGETAGAEALVRYHHKDLGIVSPEKYIRMLEHTKLSHYLDMYVFEEVCKTLARWEQQGKMLMPVSIHFAGSTLRRTDVVEDMLSIVKRLHVLCEYLEIEVCESSAGLNKEMTAEASNKIRKENIRVVLKNFGGRNSGFSILSIMEFDGLKLDKGIVTNIVGNRSSQIVAKAIIDICRQLGVPVSATGVETQDQLNMLKELGCDYAQGNFFNKPITIDTFEVRYMND